MREVKEMDLHTWLEGLVHFHPEVSQIFIDIDSVSESDNTFGAVMGVYLDTCVSDYSSNHKLDSRIWIHSAIGGSPTISFRENRGKDPLPWQLVEYITNLLVEDVALTLTFDTTDEGKTGGYGHYASHVRGRGEFTWTDDSFLFEEEYEESTVPDTDVFRQQLTDLGIQLFDEQGEARPLADVYSELGEALHKQYEEDYNEE